ncbi:hypothetical protein G9A89_006468 [Geosiphon pyriformis]|nr:hypothetical protein G9A89_006468 [Geosiphon pyriformis]
MQFSFVFSGVCYKWDVMIRKGLRIKAGLPCDFLNEVLHYLFLYNLKLFEQVQSKEKLTLLILFSNATVLLDAYLIIDSWICNLVNNFLAGVVKIFLENELLLANNLPSAFCGSGNFLMSGILGQSKYYKYVFSLKQFGVVFDLRGPMPYWFSLTFGFMNKSVSLEDGATTAVKKNVYTDGSLRFAGSAEVVDKTVTYFPAANTGIGVKVAGLLFSTLTELQAVVLALKCVPSLCLVVLYSDSQFTINAYNLLKNKNISIKWVKVKRHLGVSGNIKTNALASEMTSSPLSLSVKIWKRFLVAEETAIFDNTYHFV